MKKLLFIFQLLVTFSGTIKAQTEQEDCLLTVSLLTVTPGAELYSSFGHSAFRVHHAQTGEDIIFNYGTFDFNDPDFYSKFVRGKLLYFVSAEEPRYFMLQYNYEGRGVTEQILNLGCEDKQQLFHALKENLREDNKYYHYDFLYDNCSSRLWEMMKKHTSGNYELKYILPEEEVRFRNLLHEYLDKGGQYWNKLGIDILLGLPVDKKMKNEQAVFLPDYLMKAMDSTTVSGSPLVVSKNVILPMTYQPEMNRFTRPLVIFTIFWVITAFLSLNRKTAASTFMKIFDCIFFMLTGAVGWLLLFMWFGTNHAACAWNLNLLWALPVNVVTAFWIFNQDKHRKYFRVLALWYLILMIIWIFLPQQMNLALIPIVATAFIRSIARAGKFL